MTMDGRYLRFSLIALTSLAFVSCGSFFQNVKENGKLIQDATDRSKYIFLGKELFACDREEFCKFVVLHKTTHIFKLVQSKEEMESIKDSVDVWEKFSTERPISNIALGKPAFLSSKYRNYTMASFAVNGQVGTTNDKSCSESSYESRPWLQIDLQSQAVVKSVAVYSFAPTSRTMKTFEVRVGNSALNGGTGNPLCVTNLQISSSSNFIRLDCQANMLGRFVTVNIIKSDFLEVCELEVYGYFV